MRKTDSPFSTPETNVAIVLLAETEDPKRTLHNFSCLLIAFCQRGTSIGLNANRSRHQRAGQSSLMSLWNCLDAGSVGASFGSTVRNTLSIGDRLASRPRMKLCSRTIVQ